MNRFQNKLQQLKEQNRLRTLSAPKGIDFTSNDYLGMRDHPALRKTAIKALENGMDLGAGGSRLLRGSTPQHEDLEYFAAGYFSSERSLYFGSGFQANLAIFQAIPNRFDTIIFDELVHASSREGINNSPAQSVKIKHNDLNAFESALKVVHKNRRAEGMIWIAVESLYSMDGDFAPVRELQSLAQKYDAMMIIDEAHATGIYQPLTGDNIISLHTCGKAVGVAGGLVCASATIIDTLINTARGFIYSTAPPPLQALLTQKSLEILATEEGDQKRATLKAHIKTMNAQSQIIPIIIGTDTNAVQIARHLQNKGYDVRAIRPPTVPEGTARLRITLSTQITAHILQTFQTDLNEIMEQKIAA